MNFIDNIKGRGTTPLARSLNVWYHTLNEAVKIRSTIIETCSRITLLKLKETSEGDCTG